ncbi:MAG: hypothetical protein ACJ8FS_16375 [Sphingomicrobium sp.]
MIKNPIRWVAVICVAITSAYVMLMGYWINDTLAGPLWCSRAIGADKVDTNSKVDAATACVSLLTIQLKSLATNSHILFGVVALCLLTLIVIVVAGARLDFKASKEGIEGHMDRSGAPQPVVVTNPPSAPVPTTATPAAPAGPAMPPPLPPTG